MRPQWIKSTANARTRMTGGPCCFRSHHLVPLIRFDWDHVTRTTARIRDIAAIPQNHMNVRMRDRHQIAYDFSSTSLSSAPTNSMTDLKAVACPVPGQKQRVGPGAAPGR
jgi:hypothetical protein